MNRQVLAVDNNEVFIKLLTHLIKKKGWSVKTAVDGLSALELLESYQPEIIFIDLVMPNIDGENLCRILRGKSEFARTTLVILSAVAFEEGLDFRAFGANACIAKGPITEIEGNIDLVLDYVAQGRVEELPETVLGYQHIYCSTVAQELLESRKNFAVTLDTMDNGFLELSGNRKIVTCNSAAAAILNVAKESLLGTDVVTHFQGDAEQYILDSLNSFVADNNDVEYEVPGEVAGRSIVIRFADIQLEGRSGVAMFLRDISTEKKARRELHRQMEHLEAMVEERTARYREVNRELEERIIERRKMTESLEFVARQWSKTFDTIPDFVSVHDKNMRFARVNKALSSFLKTPPEELVGKYCYEVMHGSTAPWHNCPHVRAINEGQTVTEEVDDPAVGIPLLVTCAPFLHDDGSLMGSVHVARNISRQKDAEREREELIMKLEKTLSKVKQLSGFLPICASCKKIRDDQGYWSQVEEYVSAHSEAVFSHGICPDCIKILYPELDIDE
ncbi:response regulator [Desulfopila sp. IMCC35008]|uniref:response regulator n=1 Tax=Desulfopila sp. IMCC35008 TaxID=2653858 RepID=UPI0013D4247E|nr:response regulator [Desulfopila sp. IMCC35008]